MAPRGAREGKRPPTSNHRTRRSLRGVRTKWAFHGAPVGPPRPTAQKAVALWSQRGCASVRDCELLPRPPGLRRRPPAPRRLPLPRPQPPAAPRPQCGEGVVEELGGAQRQRGRANSDDSPVERLGLGGNCPARLAGPSGAFRREGTGQRSSQGEGEASGHRAPWRRVVGRERPRPSLGRGGRRGNRRCAPREAAARGRPRAQLGTQRPKALGSPHQAASTRRTASAPSSGVPNV
jgi:hypothetical protein